MIRRRLLTLLAATPVLLALGANAEAQVVFNLSTPGARAASMGGAFIAVADDATTAITNPAGLSNLSIPEIYGEMKASSGSDCTACNVSGSPFLSFLSVAVPLSPRMTIAGLLNQNVHFRTRNVNGEDVDEYIYAVALGAQVASHLRVGVNVGLVHATFSRSDSTNGFRISGGIQYQAMEKLTLGLTGAGVSQITFDGGVLDDSRIGGGVAYAALPKLLISADVSRYLATDDFDFTHPTTYGAGAEYVVFSNASQRIFVRGGLCTCNPFYDGASGTVGVGYATQRRFQADLAYASGLKELTLSGVFRY